MIKREKLLEEFESIEWPFAVHDLAACQELANRIARTGRLGANLISYSNLVSGVTFNLPTVNGGEPYTIDTYNWEGLDRKILGDFLGYISATSYREADFLASALVVGLEKNRPSDIFFSWMHDLNVLPKLTDEAISEFWVEQTTKAVSWYKANPKGFEI